ncbi:hypothetical protein [Nocardioides nitrophenolicus]|uniref:hypothetical protein n=1 Tax=Nocardioides nitrophenolicus TaxID=60489 RepID=UPI00195C0479|nr:hypothetical protein [Nocardioides nitrophenolicus]MBM7516816.1 hypothetical protein [Nocardioides nitrophenolicus]
MAKKQKAWIHVGMPGAGDIVEPALAHHHAALVELGVASLAHTSAESFRAAVEMTRSHKDWGLKRADVEGQWTRLVRRARKTRCDLVFSQSLLASATADQVALLVDALAGCQVHVVLTTGLDDETAALTQWQAACRKPERLHVLETDGLEPAEVWKAFGKLVGFGTASLGLGAVPSASATLQTLPEALREVERLARRNASLEVRLEELDRKRRKLKRRLNSAA